MKDSHDNENIDVIVFADEEGNELEFYEVAFFEHKGKEYSALASAEESADDEEGLEIVFCEVSLDEEGFEVFEPVSDEELEDELFEVFESIKGHECGCGCGCDGDDDDDEDDEYDDDEYDDDDDDEYDE
ncbi:MAG: DUF1292 domain-containing protein [Clostridia bacterium]